MRRKYRKVGEIEAMDLVDAGVRTRAMAATETVRKKRRRLNDEEEAEYRVSSSRTSTTSYIQLRSRRILVDHRRRRNENPFLSPNLDCGDDVSCCSSSTGSTEKRTFELPDPEDESLEVETSTQFSCRERREMTPSSELRAGPEDLDSTSRPSEANSRRRSTVETMPTEAELEEFFAAAEKRLQKEFAEKYVRAHSLLKT
ncbi:hypothetical protein DITRI_Ditri18aG0092600 [Diplodiscus trichospermus]